MASSRNRPPRPAAPAPVSPAPPPAPAAAQADSEQHDSPIGCLLRMIWLMGGAVFLLATAALVAVKSEGQIGRYDLMHLGVALAIIGARYLDVAFFRGATSDGKPATLRDAHRFALLVAVGGGAAWGLARLVA